MMRFFRFKSLKMAFYSRVQLMVITEVKKPSVLYRTSVAKGLVKADVIQMRALQLMDELHNLVMDIEKRDVVRCVATGDNNGWLNSFFSWSPLSSMEVMNSSGNTEKNWSFYMHGGTGCGKTYIMDLFFHSLPIQRKRRTHFHDFMLDVHKRIHRGKGTKCDGQDRIDKVANEILAECFVLCFDEFQVTDIADAMLLTSLFNALFSKGLILVATSNRRPEDLYYNGLQRDLFLPFIALLKQQARIFSFSDDKGDSSTHTDYRALKFAQMKQAMYFYPLHENSKKSLFAEFWEYLHPPKKCLSHLPSFLSARRYEKIELAVYGHIFPVSNAVPGRRSAWFTFQELCENNYGAVDFIELAKKFCALAITDVPRLDIGRRNELRRFITLIDTLYEHKVLLFLEADEPIEKLFEVNMGASFSVGTYDEVFSFDRTRSRLLEMQSEAYITESMKKKRQGVELVEWALKEMRSSPLVLGDFKRQQDWFLKELWHFYRIGGTDEVIQTFLLGGHSEVFEIGKNEGKKIKGDFGLLVEAKQVIRESCFEILLYDVVEVLSRDVNVTTNDLLYSKLHKCLKEELQHNSITGDHSRVVRYVRYQRCCQSLLSLMLLIQDNKNTKVKTDSISDI